VPTGHDGLTPLQQAKYVVRWDFGKAAYYVGAHLPAGGQPSYFSGVVSKSEGILSPTNPDSLFAFGNIYAALGPATGRIIGDTMVIDVPRSAVGGPKPGSELQSVGTYTMVGADDAAVILETLPITVDSSPTFDTRLTPAGTPAKPGSGKKGPGGGLATTGGSYALAGVGAVLLVLAAALQRRRRTS
jgi:hypothetical protein